MPGAQLDNAYWMNAFGNYKRQDVYEILKLLVAFNKQNK